MCLCVCVCVCVCVWEWEREYLSLCLMCLMIHCFLMLVTLGLFQSFATSFTISKNLAQNLCMFRCKLPRFWNKSAAGMLTTSSSSKPRSAWWWMALVLRSHLSSSQKKQNGRRKYANHTQERTGKWRRRLTDGGAGGDRRWSARIAGRPCQSHQAERKRGIW